MINGQASDVWSFACIFSVATTWVVGGSYLMDRYAKERRAARQHLGLEDMDCFHDNHKLLPIIERWHRRLVEYARKNDDITVRIWHTVLKPAFIEHVYSRNSVDQLQSTAAELCTRGGWAEPEKRVNEICVQELSWEALVLHERKWHIWRTNGGLDPRHSRQGTLSIDSSTLAFHDASSTGYLPPTRVMSQDRFNEEPVSMQPVPDQGSSHQSPQSPIEYIRRVNTTRREQELTHDPKRQSKSTTPLPIKAGPTRTTSIEDPSTNRLVTNSPPNPGMAAHNTYPSIDTGKHTGINSPTTTIQAWQSTSAQVGDKANYPSCPKSKSRRAEPLPYKSVDELLRHGKSKFLETDEKLKESMKGRDIVRRSCMLLFLS